MESVYWPIKDTFHFLSVYLLNYNTTWSWTEMKTMYCSWKKTTKVEYSLIKTSEIPIENTKKNFPNLPGKNFLQKLAWK